VDNQDELASFVNRRWKVWMPVWLFPGLSIADSGFSFQDFPLEPPRKTSFAMKCLRMVLSYATVVPLFTWQPCFNFYRHSEQKWTRSFTGVFFSSAVINETAVCTVSSGSWFIDTSLALPRQWGPHKIRTRDRRLHWSSACMAQVKIIVVVAGSQCTTVLSCWNHVFYGRVQTINAYYIVT